jgi:hypothetical protein
MVFFSGRGWVGFVALVAFGVPIQWLAESRWSVPYVTWPLSITFALAGLLCWVCGRAWNGATDDRAGTGRHTLFFVPLEYWGPVMWIGSLVNLALSCGNAL